MLGFDTNAKVNPPLRSEWDREAIMEGLADGTIDAIACDHAPHSVMEKDVEFAAAAFGLIGLETSLGLSLRLVHEGVLTMSQLIAKMSANPAAHPARPRRDAGPRLPRRPHPHRPPPGVDRGRSPIRLQEPQLSLSGVGFEGQGSDDDPWREDNHTMG